MAATTEALRRPLPGASRVRALALGAAVLLGEAILAAGVVDSRAAKILLILPAVLGIAFVVRWPLAATGVVLAFVASAVSPSIVILHVAGLNARPHELILAVLLVLAVVAPRRQTWGGVAGGALFAFLVLVAIAGALTVSTGTTSLSDALQWGRPFAVLLLFYVVVRLLPTRAQIERLLAIGSGLAGVSGVLAALAAAGMNLTFLFGPDAATYVMSDLSGAASSLDRIRLPGVALAYVLIWYAVLRVLRTRGTARLLWSLAVAGMALNLALSFNRNMWLGAFLGLIALAILGGNAFRRRVVYAVALFAIGVVIVVLSGAGAGQDSTLGPLVQRGSTLLNPTAVGQESSLKDRENETLVAWRSVQAHPVIGIGPGTSFGKVILEVTDNRLEPTPQLFLHNQYLYLLVIAGVPGLLAFLVFLGGSLASGARRLDDPTVLTCTIGLGMIMISAFVMIAFADYNTAAAVALPASVIVALGGARRAAADPI